MAEKARSDLASPSRQHETWRNDVEGHSTSTCGGGDRPGCTSTTRSDDATTGRTRRGAHTPLRRGCDRSERGIQSRIVRSRASIGALEAASPRALSAVVSHTGRGRLATAARADRVRRRVTQDGGRAWRGHPADGRRGEVGLRGVGEQNAALRTQCASSWTSMELQAWNGERIWQAVLTRSCPQASFHFQVPALTLLYTTCTAVGGLRCPPVRKPPSFLLRTTWALTQVATIASIATPTRSKPMLCTRTC